VFCQSRIIHASLISNPTVVDLRRRFFMRGALPSDAAQTVVQPPRPPWARLGAEAFTKACTRCGDCLRACPRGVLRSGDGGFPEIDFSRQGCSLCGQCSQVCPSGAITPLAAQVPAFNWRVQVGETCLARKGIECRVCGEACEAQALRFVPARGGASTLRVLAERCTGCGECVAPCPTAAITLK
jgi:ferredoxin-type protein NapF